MAQEGGLGVGDGVVLRGLNANERNEGAGEVVSLPNDMNDPDGRYGIHLEGDSGRIGVRPINIFRLPPQN